jgi:hypothetical protein
MLPNTPNYQRPPMGNAPSKYGTKGQPFYQELREKRAGRKSHEDGEKAKVRKRDKFCRWHGPKCPNTMWTLEVAHLTAKGMSGDKSGERSKAHRMIRVCKPIHQDPDGLEQHGKRVRPLDKKKGTSGPCAFEERRGKLWVIVAIERAVGVFV